jgi:hypothetical protein
MQLSTRCLRGKHRKNNNGNSTTIRTDEAVELGQLFMNLFMQVICLSNY